MTNKEIPPLEKNISTLYEQQANSGNYRLAMDTFIEDMGVNSTVVNKYSKGNNR